MTNMQDSVDTILPTVFARQGTVFANSRDLAAFFEKRHDNVVRDIDNLLKSLNSSKLRSAFEEVTMPDGQGIGRRTFDMTRDGFALLAMGFTGDKALRFKEAYIEAFNAMEAQVKFAIAPPARPGETVMVTRLPNDDLHTLRRRGPVIGRPGAPFVDLDKAEMFMHPHQLRVLGALRGLADVKGFILAGVAEIARAAGLSVHNTDRAIHFLQAVGMVFRVRNRGLRLVPREGEGYVASAVMPLLG